MYITTSRNQTGGRMKIAVATIDGISLSQHFGQSKGFVVFDTEGTAVRGGIPHHQRHAAQSGRLPSRRRKFAGGARPRGHFRSFERLRSDVVRGHGRGRGPIHAGQRNQAGHPAGSLLGGRCRGSLHQRKSSGRKSRLLQLPALMAICAHFFLPLAPRRESGKDPAADPGRAPGPGRNRDSFFQLI